MEQPGNWIARRLDELAFVGRGRSKHRPRNDASLYGGEYPFIQTAEIHRSGLYITSYSQTYNELGLKQSKMWEANTLCITNAGENTGDCAILSFKACFPDSIIGVIADDSNADIRFLKYYFDTIKPQIKSITKGATQDNLSVSKLLSFKIPTPPLAIQSKIADVLSAYDNLIENNLRRIHVLEGMVQTIYQEWFVNFRFPGHESFHTMDSPFGKIPEEWNVGALADVLSCLESGSRPRGGAYQGEDGVPSIGAENIIGLGRYDYTKEKYVSREYFRAMRRGLIRSGDVLLYKDGAQIGRKSMFRDGFPHEECAVNEHVFILRANEHCTQNYLYLWLDREDVTEKIRNLNSNAAQPGINQSGVKSLPILIPDKPTLDHCEEIADPILAEVFNLAKRNLLLRKTRDLLLPRLVSGEIDVSRWETSLAEEAA